MKQSKRKYPGELAFAWECDFGICAWAEPTIERLMDGRCPSPEAKPVKVRILKESDFRKIIHKT